MDKDAVVTYHLTVSEINELRERWYSRAARALHQNDYQIVIDTSLPKRATTTVRPVFFVRSYRMDDFMVCKLK